MLLVIMKISDSILLIIFPYFLEIQADVDVFLCCYFLKENNNTSNIKYKLKKKRKGVKSVIKKKTHNNLRKN